MEWMGVFRCHVCRTLRRKTREVILISHKIACWQAQILPVGVSMTERSSLVLRMRKDVGTLDLSPGTDGHEISVGGCDWKDLEDGHRSACPQVWGTH